MEQPVKPGPGRRDRKARATRRRVLEAAETLFVRPGYTATRIAAIADAADVAVQTVYAVFGTKRAVLSQLLELRTVGDDESTPLRDRANWQAMEHETDPYRQVALLAAIATGIGQRIAVLSEVIAAAAGSDPEIAAMYQRRQQARYQDQHRVAHALLHAGALRVGLSEAKATDIMWTLANPHTYHTLVGERGWATVEYERWLARMLAAALLTESGSSTGARS
ncbi:MAG: TetR/AcrR family transcriptional regulator [Chloroflexota bacterium]